ncbi:DUF3307 domain-containing protein [Exiguobacterium sp. s160]|uniref:DUF3307 domain-containing protein n=1 Tax=Exiguobacterium sp. s160 TaxID=2751265 RepID=UPI001BEC89BD|nr:DUF3307 domain-containing protein [Exiguobacterium sp. s160]
MLILILILAHLIADYPLQTNKIIEKKLQGFVGVLQHVVIHLFTYVVIIFISSSIGLINFNYLILFYVFLICLAHLLIDLIKENLNNRIAKCKGFSSYQKSIMSAILYISDQVIHLGSIVILSLMVFENYDKAVTNLFSNLISSGSVNLEIDEKVIITLIIILVNTYFSGYLISIILKEFKPTNKVTETIIEGSFINNNADVTYERFSTDTIENDWVTYSTKSKEDIKLNKKISIISDSPAKAGMWIGILERNLILLLCVSNSLSSIGFLIAMKALTRFKQFDDKSFSEYYLIGTMLSIIFGMSAGFITKFIW